MSIPSSNFPAVALLSEIDLQCKLIIHNGARLQESAQHWIAIDKGIDDGKKALPIDIVAYCSICLSAAASIYKNLFLGARVNKKTVSVISKRCTELMRLLENPSLPVISAIAVRNSWEHMDERLDSWLSSRIRGTSCAGIHVSVKPPKDEVFVLRHFDPVLMEIKHGKDESIHLQPLITEAEKLSQLIDNAFKKLQNEQSNIYAF